MRHTEKWELNPHYTIFVFNVIFISWLHKHYIYYYQRSSCVKSLIKFYIYHWKWSHNLRFPTNNFLPRSIILDWLLDLFLQMVRLVSREVVIPEHLGCESTNCDSESSYFRDLAHESQVLSGFGRRQKKLMVNTPKGNIKIYIYKERNNFCQL